MPSSSSRSRAATRRSPRAAARQPTVSSLPARRERPLLAPFAAVFGLLVAAEVLYLGYLLWDVEPGWHWYLVPPLLLAVWAGAGAALVWLGRGRGWLVLTTAAVLPLLAVVGLVGLFGYLGEGRAVGEAALLLAGPVGCLALAPRRPVREWTRPRRAARRRPGPPSRSAQPAAGAGP
ncbi:hypothetical protein DQ238_21825 [Geodermatophilus sp. TF02-6]|uniref:hypothetical protein n=1 Tax=Geodermatophilus sp. TF02-6 TaxID=2250575 RepID=UPI000DE8C97F|nr:hypothetical protein [Geodermatophilus sp. TF02-6]RBY74481.1 hypothetical protein DQ238_21825 [Geodermatophilus sp. TF02-6]